MGKSDLEDELEQQLRSGDIPQDFERQFKFAAHLKRRYAADFAYPALKLLIEVEGATWSGGRHTTGIGFHNDCVKYNLATLLGYSILRFDNKMVHDGTALAVVTEYFQKREEF